MRLLGVLEKMSQLDFYNGRDLQSLVPLLNNCTNMMQQGFVICQ